MSSYRTLKLAQLKGCIIVIRYDYWPCNFFLYFWLWQVVVSLQAPRVSVSASACCVHKNVPLLPEEDFQHHGQRRQTRQLNRTGNKLSTSNHVWLSLKAWVIVGQEGVQEKVPLKLAPQANYSWKSCWRWISVFPVAGSHTDKNISAVPAYKWMVWGPVFRTSELVLSSVQLSEMNISKPTAF